MGLNGYRTRLRTAVVVAACLMLAASQAHAGTVVVADTLGPGDSYSGGSWSVRGPDSGSVNQNIAASFTPTSDATLDSVDLALVLNAGTSSVLVRLLADSAGLPDEASVLESWTLSIGASSVYSVSSVVGPTLTQGTKYWVGVFPGASDTWAGWHLNDQGFTGFAVKSTGAWSSVPSESTPAFRVTATEVSVVPLPSSALIGVCLLGALFVIGRLRSEREHQAGPGWTAPRGSVVDDI